LTRLIDGPLSPARRLTVDFTAFMERLEAMPGLDHEKLARYLAGVDLIMGLAGPPDAGFGRATPGLGDDAEVSEQLAAITDDALSAAEDLLEAAYTYADDYYYMANVGDDRQEGLSPELRLALTELGNEGPSAARSALSKAPAAIGRAVAPEFI
jgi:hypothetical protein